MPRKKKEPEAAPVVETIPEPVVEPVAQSRRKGGRPTKAKPIESPSPELEVSPVIDLAPEPEPEKKPRKKRGRASEAEPEPTELSPDPEVASEEPAEIAEMEPTVAPLKSTDRFQSPEFPDRRMKPNPLFVETKSKRVQLLLQPSLYEKMKSLAEINNKSFNEYVHLVFESFVREREQERN